MVSSLADSTAFAIASVSFSSALCRNVSIAAKAARCEWLPDFSTGASLAMAVLSVRNISFMTKRTRADCRLRVTVARFDGKRKSKGFYGETAIDDQDNVSRTGATKL